MLHRLADILYELGEDVCLVTSRTNGEKSYPVVECQFEQAPPGLEVEEDDWVVYPERLDGNPLQAKNVVRWLLNVPGARGGSMKYGENDLFFHFGPNFRTKAFQSSGLLRVHDFELGVFKKSKRKRLGIAIIIRKSRSYRKSHSLEKVGVPVVDFISDLKRDQVAKFMNSLLVFVSYDTESFHSVQAALSGALSVVVPRRELTRSDFYRSEIMKYGVAYGFRGVPWAILTRHKVESHLRAVEEKDLKTVTDFVSILRNK